MQMIQPEWWEEWVKLNKNGIAELKKGAPDNVAAEFEAYFKTIEESLSIVARQ